MWKENSSKEFNNDQIKELIENKRKQRWEFVFLAANQDAFSTAAMYGIDAGQTVNFAANGAGTRAAYMSMSTLVGNYRSGVNNEEERPGMDANESN